MSARPPKCKVREVQQLDGHDSPGRIGERCFAVGGDRDPEPHLGGGQLLSPTLLSVTRHTPKRASRTSTVTAAGLAFEIVTL